MIRKYLKRHSVCIKGLLAWLVVSAIATASLLYYVNNQPG